MYEWRHQVQNYIRKFKEFKRMAMRSDKTDTSSPDMVDLAAGIVKSRYLYNRPQDLILQMRIDRIARYAQPPCRSRDIVLAGLKRPPDFKTALPLNRRVLAFRTSPRHELP